MYLLVNKSDNVIIGYANRLVNEKQAEQDGYEVFEIEDAEFSPKMLGSKIESYDES
jgi:N-dimethylarginine dimethylaminohydrolase